MSLVASLIAGVIGATIASGQWPRRCPGGALSVVIGLFAGLAIWAAAGGFGALDRVVATFLLIMALGVGAGAAASFAAGGLIQRARSAKPRTSNIE
ncbi:MAG: hypothetical protein AAGE76_16185 [Pseudomonadota bacterium]